MKYEYDVTVIIPIYNREKYLSRSINSVLKQKYKTKKIEILLINDGSTDKSKEVCLQYVSKYKNIKYFEQENKGVSAARNVGLKNAKGKYITFLDSDDTISNDVIKNLTSFFDKHYDEVDLVTFPIFLQLKKRKILHVRLRALPFSMKTGVYNLKKPPFFIQTNINIFIKNNQKIFFNESRKQMEDQEFNIEILSKKRKIGFCNKGEYIYYRTSSGLGASTDNPYYSFKEDYELYKKYFKSSILSKYKQTHILYNFANKLKRHDFNNPYFLQHFKKQYFELLNKIDDDVISFCPYLNEYQKAYFWREKGTNGKLIKSNSKFLLVSDSNFEMGSIDYIETVITKIKIIKNNLWFCGFVKSPILNFLDVEMYIKSSDKIIKVPLSFSTFSYYQSPTITNGFLRFSSKLPLTNATSFEIYYKYKDFEIKSLFYFHSMLPSNVSVLKEISTRDYFLKLNNNIVEIKNNNLFLYKLNKIKIYLFYFTKNFKILLNRFFAVKTKKQIYLYNDSRGVIDNGYYQFLYDNEKKDHIKRYYISDSSKAMIKQMKKTLNTSNIIRYKSLKHRRLFFKAAKIFTSFIEFSAFSPFGKNYNNYLDLTNHEVIYLQHGVLHANLPNLYSKEKTFIDKVVISSDFEKENLIKNYAYDKKDLICTGMPRLDISKKNTIKTKILIALSWRTNLIGGIDSKTRNRTLFVDQFLKSDYFKETQKLLSNFKLSMLLTNNNLTLEFMPHPIFREYSKQYKNIVNNIKIVEKANPSDYALIITDYSSIVFDYVYNDVPVIYFVPDYELFQAGVSHNYNKLDLPLEEGFGPLTFTSEQLLKELKKLIKKNYVKQKKYQNKYDSFFITKDNHREKLYNYLKEGEDEI